MQFAPTAAMNSSGDDTFDYSVDISAFSEYVVGHCENCNKEYRWINIFTFSHVEDIEEVS